MIASRRPAPFSTAWGLEPLFSPREGEEFRWDGLNVRLPSTSVWANPAAPNVVFVGHAVRD